jgi:Icc-related predicted phosphoesterase
MFTYPDKTGQTGGMRIQLFSDLHLEMAVFAGPADGVEVDVVILAGDIHARGRKAPGWARRDSIFGDKPEILFVPGNHEFYGCVVEDELELMRAECDAHRVTLLHCTERLIDDVRFLGCTLWSDFALPIRSGWTVGLNSDPGEAMEHAGKRMNDYNLIERRAAPRRGRTSVSGQSRSARPGSLVTVTPSDTLGWHWQQRSWLKRSLAQSVADGVRATVVVTHHAPCRLSIPAEYVGDRLSAAYSSDLLDDVLSTARQVPTLWVHGHIHKAVDYTHTSGCRIVSNPRGYRHHGHQSSLSNEQFDRIRQKQKHWENESFDRGLVIEV